VTIVTIVTQTKSNDRKTEQLSDIPVNLLCISSQHSTKADKLKQSNDCTLSLFEAKMFPLRLLTSSYNRILPHETLATEIDFEIGIDAMPLGLQNTYLLRIKFLKNNNFHHEE